MRNKEYALRLPMVESYSKNTKDPGGPTVSFNISWALKHVIPGIKCERIRGEKRKEVDWDGRKEECWYETYLYYIEDDEEVARIKEAYANFDNLPDWNDFGYDKEAYDKADEEYDKVNKYLSDHGWGGPFLGCNYGIGFDMANNDLYASSFKSYLIERYMALDEVSEWWKKVDESKWEESQLTPKEVNDAHVKVHKLWIERDKIMYKKWALKMQGFDLDKWEKENKEWIDSIA